VCSKAHLGVWISGIPFIMGVFYAFMGFYNWNGFNPIRLGGWVNPKTPINMAKGRVRAYACVCNIVRMFAQVRVGNEVVKLHKMITIVFLQMM